MGCFILFQFTYGKPLPASITLLRFLKRARADRAAIVLLIGRTVLAVGFNVVLRLIKYVVFIQANKHFNAPP